MSKLRRAEIRTLDRLARSLGAQSEAAMLERMDAGWSKEIPDRGYCIARTYRRHLNGAGYAACFLTKREATRAAQRLADAEGHDVELVRVQARGEDRFVVDVVKPQRASRHNAAILGAPVPQRPRGRAIHMEGVGLRPACGARGKATAQLDDVSCEACWRTEDFRRVAKAERLRA